MKFSGLVGLFGHRQVGKTTLLEQLCNRYYTLDTKTEREQAENHPAEYLAERAGTWIGLDECQSVPSLFPELKDWVRRHKKPGQFLLSGSIRFTSKEAIRESLTGRIINLELLPFSVSELENYPLPSFCYDVIEMENLDSITGFQPRTNPELRHMHARMIQYFETGGLPGICFIRDEKLRHQKINEQMNTMLDRDLRLVKKIQLPLGELRAILTSLAGLQGKPLDYTRIKRETGVSTPSIKKILYALEAIFLIRRIPIEGSTQGGTVFFEDQAEHAFNSEQKLTELEKLTHFCFTNLRSQFEYRLGETTQTFQYRTRGGAFIPLAFRNKRGCLGILPVTKSDQVQRVLGSVNSFLKAYSRSKVLIVHPEVKPPELIQPRALSLPIGQII